VLERRSRAVGAELEPGAQEGLLRHLLDVLRLAEEAAGEPEDAPLVAAHQRGEGVLVAAQAQADELVLGSNGGGGGIWKAHDV
jgi:hypothetical protein